jgi:hypothetical protein
MQPSGASCSRLATLQEQEQRARLCLCRALFQGLCVARVHGNYDLDTMFMHGPFGPNLQAQASTTRVRAEHAWRMPTVCSWWEHVHSQKET